MRNEQIQCDELDKKARSNEGQPGSYGWYLYFISLEGEGAFSNFLERREYDEAESACGGRRYTVKSAEPEQVLHISGTEFRKQVDQLRREGGSEAMRNFFRFRT